MRRRTVSPSAASSTSEWWPGVGDQQGAAGQRDCLAGEAQLGGRRGRRDVRAVTTVQGALRLVLADQVVEQHLESVRMTLAGELGHDVALGIDHHQGRPGLDGVLLPGREVRVVEHRVVHAVALHRAGQRHRVGLVRELRGVHPHGHQDVGEPLLERAQLVQDVQAVDAAEGPEVEQHDLAAQSGQGQVLAAGVQPVPAGQLGCPHPAAPRSRREIGGRHGAIQPPGHRPPSQRVQKEGLDRYRDLGYCSGTENDPNRTTETLRRAPR